MLYDTLIKYCSLFLHKMDKENIRLFLETSPQYPNLLSVIQTLQYAKLDIQAGQCNWEHLRNLESPFLLHVYVKSQEALIISKWDLDFDVLRVLNPQNSKWETKEKIYLDNIWDGVVIYTNAKTIKDSYFKKILLLVFCVIVFCSILVILKQYGLSCFFVLPVVIGLIVSFCAYWRKYVAEIEIVEKICNKSSMFNCNAVENSMYGNLKGMSMSCMALSFFISQLICMTVYISLEMSDVLYSLYFVSAIVFIPIAFYSLYSQIKIGKTCPLCMMILICVCAEALLYINMSKWHLSFEVLVLWAIMNTCVLYLLQLSQHIRQNKQEQLKEKMQLLKLKRKKEIILLESSLIEPILTPIWFGMEKAPINITTIISPGCIHCRKVVSELLTLIDKGVKFRWNIVLGKVLNEDAGEIEAWVHSYISNKKKFFQNLRLWSKNQKFLLQRFSRINNQDVKVHEISNEFENQIKSLNVVGFPKIVLNDRLLSTVYSIKDLEFIITDLSQ